MDAVWTELDQAGQQPAVSATAETTVSTKSSAGAVKRKRDGVAANGSAAADRAVAADVKPKKRAAIPIKANEAASSDDGDAMDVDTGDGDGKKTADDVTFGSADEDEKDEIEAEMAGAVDMDDDSDADGGDGETADKGDDDDKDNEEDGDDDDDDDEDDDDGDSQPFTASFRFDIAPSKSAVVHKAPSSSATSRSAKAAKPAARSRVSKPSFSQSTRDNKPAVKGKLGRRG